MIHYPYGTPTWVELGSPDVDASVAFYSDLFDWKASVLEQAIGYWLFSSGDKFVSGIKPLQNKLLSPQWMTYISTDDAVRTASRVETAGGKVLMETDISEAMRMIVLQDTVGAVFGIFQGSQFGGAQLFNQPVSLTFNLLMTRKPLVGKRFYSEVFGWDPRDRDMGPGFVFTYFFNGVRGVAGLMAMNEQSPQDVPSHWQVSFAVDNVDATVTRALALGGRVLQPPRNTPFGRSALLTDPHGAVFSISQQTPEVRAAAQRPEGVLL